MKLFLIFVVILLTTLSIVNAVNIPLRKRVTTFTACKAGAPEFNGAVVDPDPPVPGTTATAKFSIVLPAALDSGKISTDATDAGGISIGGFPQEQDVCTLEGVTCPIASGSTIDFQTPLKIPDDAPGTYTLQYSLVDGTGKEIACSSGPVTGAAGDAKGKDGGDGGDGGAKGKDGGDGGDGGKGKDGDGGPAGPGPAGPPPPDGGPDGGPDGDGGPAKGKGKGDGGPGGPGGPDGGPDGGPGGPDGGPDGGPGGPGGPDGGPDGGPGGPGGGPDGPTPP